MAKKTAKKEESATPTKATAKDSAKTTKKAPVVAKAATSAPKAGSVKTKVSKAAAPKAAAKSVKPKVAPIKLTESQNELLKKVHGSTGYSAEKKIEERSLNALLGHKLIKKGAKDKASGKVPHTVSAAGKKHVESQGTGSTS